MHILIPVKQFAQAKTRLACALTPAQRAGLMLAMLEDLLDCIGRLDGVEGVVLLSGEPALAALCRRRGCELMREARDAHDLNAAVTAALAQLGRRGVTRAMVLHGDLPLAEAADLQILVDRFPAQHANALQQGGTTVLVPDRVGAGTNAMVVDLPLRFVLRYGEDSFGLHLRQCHALGLRVVVERLASLSLDVDHAQDLHAVACAGTGARAAAGVRTCALLQSLGYGVTATA